MREPERHSTDPNLFRPRLAPATLLFLAIATGASAAPPVTVSPGGADRVEGTASSCPTFSWGGDPSVETWELVVHRLVDRAAAAEDSWRQVLSIPLPGSVSSWTPSLEDCLDSGETYVWFVGSDDDAWSAGRLFEVVDPRPTEPARVDALLDERLGRNGSAQPVRVAGGRATSDGTDRSAPLLPSPTRAAASGVPGGTGFSVDSQGTAWGNAFILRCGSGAASSFFLDFDGDGFGDLSNPALACMLPGGYAANGDDCDDAESAINPGAAEVCDGNDTNCDGTVDGGPSCATGQPGVCAAGVETCVEASLECLPVTVSSPEVCDALDNDCDGLADESLAQECFDGNPGQIGIGICQAGIQTCTAGSFGSCEGQVPPQAEMCNGLDDDCNGVVDDGLSLTEPLYPPDLGSPLGAACGTGDCAGGTVICSGDGASAVCSTDLNRTPEVCDGLDNDCDGVVDDDC